MKCQMCPRHRAMPQAAVARAALWERGGSRGGCAQARGTSYVIPRQCGKALPAAPTGVVKVPPPPSPLPSSPTMRTIHVQAAT